MSLPARPVPPESPPAPGRASWRPALALGVVSATAQTTVGLLGASAAVPDLAPSAPGFKGWLPPWDLAAGPSAWTVTALLVVAALTGGAAVLLGLRAWRAGARADLRVVAALAGVVLAVMVAVPAQGSADHLSYAAYGRIAAQGDDPYVEDPLAWRGGTDPVTSSVQPPWQHTRSVYGPVATAAQAATGWWGAGNLRATVGAWQLLCGLAFAGAALALHAAAGRRARGAAASGSAPLLESHRDPHARVAVLWTLNPLLLGQLVLGAHLDVLAVATAVGGLVLLARRPLLAGALLGAAVGIKAPYALAALAAAVALLGRGRPGLPPALRAAAGGLLVLVPAHLWSGPHTYDQLRAASRFISLAAPWRLVADVADPLLGTAAVRSVVPRLAWVAALGLAWLLWRRARVHAPAAAAPDDVSLEALRWFALTSLAWVLTAPYVLPWYDAMMWAPLALLAWGPTLDAALLARLVVLVLAYVPGLNVGVPAALTTVTIGARHYVAPWLTAAVLVVVVRWAWRRAPDLRTDTRSGGDPA
ncbi:MAG: hypothetical protein U0Q15_01235 [Kineosporiaceae bacterium]